jgi:hypothetical protein|nr:hypothetical protein [Kofleriaceae bacterium]
MRGLLATCAWAAALAGCASAGGFGGQQDDGGTGKADAPRAIDASDRIDARLPIDATLIDGTPVMIDAAVPIDAPPPPPPPPDACVPQVTELLANPTFDLEPVGMAWTQVPIQNVQCSGSPCGPFPLITSDGAVQSMPYTAFLGSITGNDVKPKQNTVTDQLYQDVAVPAGTTQLVLTGYYVVGTTEAADDPNVYDTADVALIQTDGTPIEDVLSVSNVTADGMTDYVAFTHTFATNVAGQTVRLRMTSTNDQINYTNFFFDTLALKATHCP